MTNIKRLDLGYIGEFADKRIAVPLMVDESTGRILASAPYGTRIILEFPDTDVEHYLKASEEYAFREGKTTVRPKIHKFHTKDEVKG